LQSPPPAVTRVLGDPVVAKPRPYIGCSVKHLPDHRVVEAAHNAVRINPTNHPRLAGLVSLVTRLRPEAEDALHPEYLAVMTTKYWGPAGVKLSVSFLDTVSQELSRKILSHMNAWGDYCNVKFLRATRDGDVRIDLSETGQYASYIGTDVKLVPAGEPTMWLSGFSLKTPASEYRRVVRHETGHCLAASTLIDCPRDLKKYPLGVRADRRSQGVQGLAIQEKRPHRPRPSPHRQGVSQGNIPATARVGRDTRPSGPAGGR
jgi:hypothetical protein